MHAPTILTNIITLSINMAVAAKQKYDVDVASINYNEDDYPLLSVVPGVHTINKNVNVTDLRLSKSTLTCQLVGYLPDGQRLVGHCPRQERPPRHSH